MKVVAYINGYSSGRSKGDAAFSVYLRGGSDTHKNLVPIKEATINEAELYALNYALSSVLVDKEEVEFVVHTSNPYVYGMFQKTEEKWNNTPRKNVELIESLRSLAESFSSFNLKLDRKSKTIKKAAESSRVVHNKLKELKANAPVQS